MGSGVKVFATGSDAAGVVAVVAVGGATERSFPSNGFAAGVFFTAGSAGFVWRDGAGSAPGNGGTASARWRGTSSVFALGARAMAA
jgi:hypothetical protein